MKLTNPRAFFKKKVIAYDTTGGKYEGIVDIYAYAKDNDGQNAVGIDCGVWLDEEDIQSIEIVEESHED